MREWLKSDEGNEGASPAGRDAAVAHDAAAFARSLDAVVARLSMMRVPLSLFKLQFVAMPAALAHNVAVAVCGKSGVLGCIAPDLFMILDMGPRPLGNRASGSEIQRLGQRIQRIFIAAPSLRASEVRISELQFGSDEGRTADMLIAELNQRQQSTITLSGRILSVAASTATEPVRRPRLPPGTSDGFATASVIPLPRATASATAPGKG